MAINGLTGDGGIMEAESKKSMQGNQTPLFPPRSTRRQEQKNLSEKVIKSMQH